MHGDTFTVAYIIVTGVIVSIPGLIFTIVLHRQKTHLETNLLDLVDQARRFWLINQMNSLAWRIENFRLNNEGQLPRSLAEIEWTFSGATYLRFVDFPERRGVLCVEHHPDDEDNRENLNFAYHPKSDHESERVTLAYYDQFSQSWHTRVIFATGPKYEFV